jgi:hypothetical protein
LDKLRFVLFSTKKKAPIPNEASYPVLSFFLLSFFFVEKKRIKRKGNRRKKEEASFGIGQEGKKNRLL